MALNEKHKISNIINLKKLEHETFKFFYSGFGLAIVFFIVLSIFVHWERRVNIKKKYRRIVSDIITIAPPETTPLEIVRRRESGIKTLHRKSRTMSLPKNDIPLKPLSGPEKIREHPVINADSIIFLVRKELDRKLMQRIKSYKDLERIVMERYYEDMSIKRDPRSKGFFSMREELLSIEDLDFGKYKALIFQHPEDKKDIEGFLYMPVSIWGTMLAPVDTLKRAVPGLAEAFTKFTHISVHIEQQEYLDSPRLMNYPFIYISADDNFVLSPGEIKNFW